MVNYYIYYSGGAIRIDKNIGATEFYIYTAGTGIIQATGLPGNITNFRIVSTEGICSDPLFSSYPPILYWSPPGDTGGGTIIAYNIRQCDGYIVSPGGSGYVTYSGVPGSVVVGDLYNGTGLYEDMFTQKWEASGYFGCVPYFEIAAVNSFGTGNYILTSGGVVQRSNSTGALSSEYDGFGVGSCANVTSVQSGNFVNVNWPSGVVGCTGNYYQGEIRIYDYTTQTDTGVRLNSVTPYKGSVNITSLTKNKYYYPVIREFHFVGVNPTGCSEVIPSYACDTSTFWYA